MNPDLSEEFTRSAVSLTSAKKQGFLLLSSGVRKISKKRWFILQGEYLYYFVDDGAKRPKGVVSLSGYKGCSKVEDKNGKFEFKIVANKIKTQSSGGKPDTTIAKTIILAAQSEKERDDWVKILQSTLESMNVNVKYGFGGARIEYNCYSKLLEVKLHDKESEVDSYCTISADKIQKGRTNTFFSSSSPVFDQEYEFEIENPNTQYIVVQLKDQNKKKDNVIGQVAVPLGDLEDHKVHESWFKMTPGKTTVNPTGHLKFSCSVVKNKLKIENLRGIDLTPMDAGGSADPFIVIACGNKKEKTPSLKRTLAPSWGKLCFTFDVNDTSLPILLEIFHDNRDGTSDFMGEVRLTLQDALDCPEDKLWPVQKKLEVGVVGDMRIAFQTRKAWILPDKHYDDLFGLLMQHNMSLTKKLAAVSNKQEKPIAECLVKAFEMRRSAVHYIKTITTAEIESTSEPNVIFRGNTVATKSVDMYMRLIGMPYLHHVLKPIVTQIMQNEKKKSCELDEFRLDEKPEKKQKVKERNLKTLKGYVSQIFQEIANESLRICPTNFRNIFEHIQVTIQKKWPDHPTVQYTSVAGFIFLRFFCPSLLAPKLFNLTDSHPPPNVARDLTLIAKTLQNLANLVHFGKKEPFMHTANDFIEENIQNMKDFLMALCKPPEHAIDEIPSKRDTLNRGREMARVHFHLEDNLEAMEEMFGKDDPDLVQLRAELEILRKEQEKVMMSLSSVSSLDGRSTPTTDNDGKEDIEKGSSGSGEEPTPPKSTPATPAPAGVEPPAGITRDSPSPSGSTTLPSLTKSTITPVSGTVVGTTGSDKKVPLKERFEKNMHNASNTSQPPPRPTTNYRPLTPGSGNLPPPPPFSSEDGPVNLVCPGCNQSFAPPDIQFKVALKQRWHLGCFKCITCQRAIDGEFINKGGPTCLDCQNHPKTCVRCGLLLNGTFINIEKKWPYHENCLTCFSCGVKLNQVGVGINLYYPENKNPGSAGNEEDVQIVCNECKKKKQFF